MFAPFVPRMSNFFSANQPIFTTLDGNRCIIVTNNQADFCAFYTNILLNREKMMFQSTRPLTLMQAFDFNVTDLRANRMGMMSSRQQDRLRFRQADVVMSNLGWAGLYWLFYMAIAGHMYAHQVAIVSGEGAVAALFLIGTVFFMGVMARRWWRLAQEISGGAVDQVIGEVQVECFYYLNQQGHYRILVDGQSLEISALAYAALNQEHAYHFYVTPDSRLVLSAEVIKN